MLSYVKSEFYRILHNKSTYLFIIICSALLVSSNILLAAVKYSEPTFGYANTFFSIVNFMSSFAMVFILSIAVATIIFGNEYGNHTMKNSVSYGISRSTIYFGKLFVEIVYAIVAFAIITAFHVASAYLLLENSHMHELSVLIRMFLASLPLLLYVLAVVNCFAFIMEGTAGAIGFDALILFAIPIISSMMGMKFELFHKLAEILPWNLINNISMKEEPFDIVLQWEGNAGYYNYWIAGMVQLILITVIGYLIYRKREIK